MIWICPCGASYRLKAELGRPVFETRVGNWTVRAKTCTRCRRDLGATRAESQLGTQMELAS